MLATKAGRLGKAAIENWARELFARSGQSFMTSESVCVPRYPGQAVCVRPSSRSVGWWPHHPNARFSAPTPRMGGPSRVPTRRDKIDYKVFMSTGLCLRRNKNRRGGVGCVALAQDCSALRQLMIAGEVGGCVAHTYRARVHKTARPKTLFAVARRNPRGHAARDQVPSMLSRGCVGCSKVKQNFACSRRKEQHVCVVVLLLDSSLCVWVEVYVHAVSSAMEGVSSETNYQRKPFLAVLFPIFPCRPVPCSSTARSCV